MFTPGCTCGWSKARDNVTKHSRFPSNRPRSSSKTDSITPNCCRLRLRKLFTSGVNFPGDLLFSWWMKNHNQGKFREKNLLDEPHQILVLESHRWSDSSTLACKWCHLVGGGGATVESQKENFFRNLVRFLFAFQVGFTQVNEIQDGSCEVVSGEVPSWLKGEEQVCCFWMFVMLLSSHCLQRHFHKCFRQDANFALDPACSGDRGDGRIRKVVEKVLHTHHFQIESNVRKTNKYASSALRRSAPYRPSRVRQRGSAVLGGAQLCVSVWGGSALWVVSCVGVGGVLVVMVGVPAQWQWRHRCDSIRLLWLRHKSALHA